MFKHETPIRVRYGETDQMGVVYYGHYAQYLEVGRTEAIRGLGLTYRELEEAGILMPVIELSIRYIRPARYDDVVTIRTTIQEMPGKSITFFSELYNEQGRHLTTGQVSLAFVRKTSGRPCPPPDILLDRLRPYFL